MSKILLEPVAVRYLACALFLAFLSLYANAEEISSFAERVALAKKIEAQKATSEYFQNKMFPAIGPALGAAMRECMSRAGASADKFTVVADVSPNGEFTRIAHEPNTNTAACLAAAMVSFRAPAPPTCDDGALPIVIDMTVTP